MGKILMEDTDNEPQNSNQDPEWQEYVVKLLPVMRRIAAKFNADQDLQADAAQFAAMHLLRKFPHQCRAYHPFLRGEITEEEWLAALDSYMRQSAKNKILTFFQSPNLGCWRTGRTVKKIDKATGKRVKVHTGPRFSSFDELHDNHGLDICDDGEITWAKVNHIALIEDCGFSTRGRGND